MLVTTVVAAGLFATARLAGDGAVFGKAVLVMVCLLAAFFGLAVIAFLMSWVAARLVIGKVDPTLHGNPFADGNLPPQQIQPREPVS